VFGGVRLEAVAGSLRPRGVASAEDDPVGLRLAEQLLDDLEALRSDASQQRAPVFSRDQVAGDVPDRTRRLWLRWFWRWPPWCWD
jgi:hypothetical protein